MVFGFRLCPDLLHRLDGFAHPFEAGGVDGAVVFHLVLVPPAADPEQEAALADLIDRGHQLGGLDRVALLHQQHAGAEFDGLGDLAGRRQHHERVHRIVILFGQIAAAGKRRLARQRDMRVLRRPDGLETALLKRMGQRHRRHRIVGEEHRATELHVILPCMSPLQESRLAEDISRCHLAWRGAGSSGFQRMPW